MKIKNIPNFHTFLLFYLVKIDNRSVKFKHILNAKTSQLLNSPSVPIINARKCYFLS